VTALITDTVSRPVEATCSISLRCNALPDSCLRHGDHMRRRSQEGEKGEGMLVGGSSYYSPNAIYDVDG
jgi:hypothetical protein